MIDFMLCCICVDTLFRKGWDEIVSRYSPGTYYIDQAEPEFVAILLLVPPKYRACFKTHIRRKEREGKVIKQT